MSEEIKNVMEDEEMNTTVTEEYGATPFRFLKDLRL